MLPKSNFPQMHPASSRWCLWSKKMPQMEKYFSAFYIRSTWKRAQNLSTAASYMSAFRSRPTSPDYSRVVFFLDNKQIQWNQRALCLFSHLAQCYLHCVYSHIVIFVARSRTIFVWDSNCWREFWVEWTRCVYEYHFRSQYCHETMQGSDSHSFSSGTSRSRRRPIQSHIRIFISCFWMSYWRPHVFLFCFFAWKSNFVAEGSSFPTKHLCMITPSKLTYPYAAL